jgi:hypothetical protein
MLVRPKIGSVQSQPLGYVALFHARFVTRVQILIYWQPFTWKAASLFIVTGVGLYFYFESEKAKVTERRSKSRSLTLLCEERRLTRM